jgi:hypothetical protein
MGSTPFSRTPCDLWTYASPAKYARSMNAGEVRLAKVDVSHAPALALPRDVVVRGWTGGVGKIARHTNNKQSRRTLQPARAVTR